MLSRFHLNFLIVVLAMKVKFTTLVDTLRWPQDEGSHVKKKKM